MTESRGAQMCISRINWPRRYFVISGVRIRVDRQLQLFDEGHQVWLGVTVYPRGKGRPAKIDFSRAKGFVDWMRRCRSVGRAKDFAGLR